MRLANKRIVVTGGTSGLGLELVRQLSGRNELIVLARPSCRSSALRDTLPDVAVFDADLAMGDQVRACADAILERYDRLDGLINNAAVQHTPTFLDANFSFETIAREVAVNLTSPCQLCARLLPALQRAPEAFILNINSGLALMPKTSSAVYCATKGGLNIFSQALSHQLEGTGIKVMQAFLPLVDTPMTAGRGSAKLRPDDVAGRIIAGIESGTTSIDVGRVKLLRPIVRVCPPLARRLMKSA